MKPAMVTNGSGQRRRAYPIRSAVISSPSASFAETGVLPEPPRELAARVTHWSDELLQVAALHRQVIDDLLPDDWTYGGKSILDFGCGIGTTLAAHHDLSGEAEFLGCDIHRPSIEWASRALSPPFTFFICEEEPPLAQPDERFDLVYACSVFTHIADPWARWLVELHRVLRPGGILVASVLNRHMSQSIFGRPWDERIGMAPAFLGRNWDEGGPCVALSEWWVREHWGRAFEILRFEDGVEHEGARTGHGWVVARRRPGLPTEAELVAVDPAEPRELPALQYNFEVLSVEAREAGAYASRVAGELQRLLAAHDRIAQSKSWQMTEPLRRLAAGARGRLRR